MPSFVWPTYAAGGFATTYTVWLTIYSAANAAGQSLSFCSDMGRCQGQPCMAHSQPRLTYPLTHHEYDVRRLRNAQIVVKPECYQHLERCSSSSVCQATKCDDAEWWRWWQPIRHCLDSWCWGALPCWQPPARHAPWGFPAPPPLATPQPPDDPTGCWPFTAPPMCFEHITICQ